jgi:hypothetical protein
MLANSKHDQNAARDRQVLPHGTAEVWRTIESTLGFSRALSFTAPRESANLAQRPKLNLTSAVDPLAPTADLGRLWYDDEIPAQFFAGRVSVRWVREHLPRAKGLKIGRGWAWYEADIVEWITSRRGVTRASA